MTCLGQLTTGGLCVFFQVSCLGFLKSCQYLHLQVSPWWHILNVMTVGGEQGKRVFKKSLIIVLKWMCRINWQTKQLWLQWVFSCYLEFGIKMFLHGNTKIFTLSEGYGFSKTYVEINSMFSEVSYTLNVSWDLTLNNIFSKCNYATMVPLRRKSISSLLVHNVSYFRHFFRLEQIFDSNRLYQSMISGGLACSVQTIFGKIFLSMFQAPKQQLSDAFTCTNLELFERERVDSWRQIHYHTQSFFRAWQWYFCKKPVNIIATSLSVPSGIKRQKLFTKTVLRALEDLSPNQVSWQVNDLTMEECNLLQKNSNNYHWSPPISCCNTKKIIKKSEAQGNRNIFNTVITIPTF